MCLRASESVRGPHRVPGSGSFLVALNWVATSSLPIRGLVLAALGERHKRESPLKAAVKSKVAAPAQGGAVRLRDADADALLKRFACRIYCAGLGVGVCSMEFGLLFQWLWVEALGRPSMKY